MNLSHLKYVIEVERTGSITQAAKNLYMGQPNLSKAIKELEAELHITLFKRGAKGVVPTEKGSEFLSYAKTILSQLDELESLYKAPTENRISFSASVPRATYVSVAFANFINHFSKECELDIHFKETSSIESINDVASGESDIAVIRCQQLYEDYFLNLIDSNDLSYETLWEFNLLVLMGENHPLAKFTDIPFHELNNYIEIVHGDFQVPSVSFSKIRKDIKPASEHKRIFVYDRGSQYDLLRDVTGSFMWVSPIPQAALAQNHFITRPCSLSGMKNKDLIIYRSKPSGYAKSFITALKDAIKDFDC